MTAGETKLRLATAADAWYIPAIEISSGMAFRSVAGLEWIADEDPLSESQILKEIEQKNVSVAEEKDGNLTGFILYNVDDDIMHILQISVHEDCQNRGLGKMLMNGATEEARRRGLSSVTLTTFRDVAFNGPFYEKLGFRIVRQSDLDDRLQAILAKEKAAGLPIDRRCAMRLSL